MTEIRFYHLQRKKLEQALPEILAKAREREYRVLVKLGSSDGIAALDKALWTHDPAGFLPHGTAHDGTEAEQPIFLTTEDDNPNAATMLVLAEGAVSEQVEDFALCCEVFDGENEEAVTAARTRWKDYKDKGFDLVYYQQDDAGRWQKKA